MRRLPYLLVLVFASLSARSEAQRPDDVASDALFRFEEDDVIETYDGESVRIYYTRAGTNAVPNADANLNGIPDYVELSATTYDEALQFYGDQGFRPPISDGSRGGDERFDVYLVDFFGSADGSYQRDACAAERCPGHMVQENDFVGYGYPSLRVAVRIIASHELFHAVQAAYTEGQGAVFSEGSATWATEMFDESLTDFERAIRGYLRDPERPLSSRSSTVVDPFAYGSALWFQFIVERFGPEIMVDLLEGSQSLPWLEALTTEFETRATTFEDEFRVFAEWGLRLGSPSGFAASERYSSLSARSATLPLADERPRHFAGAMRVYELNPNGRTRVVAALDQAGPLTLLMVPRGAEGVRVERLVRGDMRVELEVHPDESVLLAVVNPASDGPSDRSSVCVGRATEVDACLDDLRPDAGTPDGGVDAGNSDGGSAADVGLGDTGVPQDAGAGSTDAGAAPMHSGGCRVGNRSVSTMPWMLLLLVLGWRRGSKTGSTLARFSTVLSWRWARRDN